MNSPLILFTLIDKHNFRATLKNNLGKLRDCDDIEYGSLREVSL